MAPKLEQIFHTDPKIIGMIEIYSNPMDRRVVQDIEKVIKNIAKNLHINLDNIPSGEPLRVYIYPTKRIFYSIFGMQIEKNMRRTSRNRGQEDMLFVVGEGEIHMVSPREMASSYTNIIKILVKDILGEYGLDEKVKKAQEKVTDELEPKEEQEEIEEEELEDDELELDDEVKEEDELDKLDDIEEIDLEIKKIKEEDSKTIPEWLDLGWIMYKRGILKGVKNQKDFGEFISENGVTSQGGISSKQSIMADYNYSSESAAAIIEYIVQSYGVRKILELFENPDIEKVLGVSKAKFSRECKAQIKRKYVSSKMKELDKNIISEKEEKIKGEN